MKDDFVIWSPDSNKNGANPPVAHKYRIDLSDLRPNLLNSGTKTNTIPLRHTFKGYKMFVSIRSVPQFSDSFCPKVFSF